MNYLDPVWFAGSIILIGFFNGAFLFYLAYFRLGEIEDHLNFCKLVEENKTVLVKAGVFGRMLRLGAVSAALGSPNYLVKRNMVDAEEVRRFPKRLKFFIQGSFFINYCVFFCMVMFSIWLKYFEK